MRGVGVGDAQPESGGYGQLRPQAAAALVRVRTSRGGGPVGFQAPRVGVTRFVFCVSGEPGALPAAAARAAGGGAPSRASGCRVCARIIYMT
jgi:hypothetical protein